MRRRLLRWSIPVLPILLAIVAHPGFLFLLLVYPPTGTESNLHDPQFWYPAWGGLIVLLILIWIAGIIWVINQDQTIASDRPPPTRNTGPAPGWKN
jgi:hypothetical protein